MSVTVPPLRILHVGKYFPPDRGGIETFLSGLVPEQRAYGHEVFVLAHAGGVPAGLATTGRVPVRRCAVWARLGGMAPVAPGLPARLLRLCHGKGRPDIIHVHCPNPAALWVAALTRIPFVLHWHADVLFPDDVPVSSGLVRGWRLVERFCLRRAARIVATSEAYRESSAFLRNWQGKCRVVPLGLPDPVEPDFSHPAVDFMRNVTDNCLLAVGRLSHYKGFSVLIRAMAQMPQVCLCLIGSGECGGELARMVDALGLRERVFLAGDVPDGVVRACMQICRIFVLPSLLRTEAFGMVLLEAMREGVPCIVSDIPGSGTGTVVRHEETGLLVPPGDAASLKEAVLRLLADPETAARMGAAGRERWLRNYAMRHVMESLNCVYAEVLREKTGRIAAGKL